MKGKKMLSPRQYAAQVGKAYTTVMSWLQSDLMPDAVKVETPTGHVYSIPEGTKPPDVKMGRPKTVTSETKPAAKKRTTKKRS
jgi:hypothetical protein